MSDNRTSSTNLISRNVRRLDSPARIPGVDLARGLALFGMLIAHLTVTSDLVWSDPATWSGIVDGRSSILFATLAGVSLAFVASPSSASARSGNGPRLRASLAAKAVFIWVLGAALATTPVPLHVILPAYGILFLIGIVLLRIPTPALLLISALLCVLGPAVVAAVSVLDPLSPAASGFVYRYTGWHYPFVLWTAFIAIGIVVGRLLRDGTRGAGGTAQSGGILRAAALLTGVGAVVSAVGYGVIGPVGNDAAGGLLTLLNDAPHESGVGEAVGSGGFAVAVIGLSVLICLTPARWILWPLRAVGSMPLTAYTLHVLSWWVWIRANPVEAAVDPIGGFQALDPLWPTVVGLLVGCTAWALIIGRGPLEALVGTVSTAVSNQVRPRPITGDN